ncbi:MAG TPA: methylated-DNA--[protein]-cysteine S-methyltransferase [Sedimentisphaerales bacterium]|nr:methylated-DNA--[protein]-cysteine S-methyltransferase [Sedimentisphaerales bacterium]HRV48988.1 methylated-DNA--[protein]-cysteine S-methyltransferase [Sedimentisphaerales bacterium]
MTTSKTRYTIFRTRWGHFGFACNDKGVCRSVLPSSEVEAVRKALRTSLEPSLPHVVFERDLARELQERITAYFEGENVDFSTDPAVDLTDRGPFERAVLDACRRIPAGQALTYAALAEKVGRPHAARAVGNALAANPIPLIVPCHRVIRTDGGLGGFSAPGGTATKQRLLMHERSLVNLK